MCRFARVNGSFGSFDASVHNVHVRLGWVRYAEHLKTCGLKIFGENKIFSPSQKNGALTFGAAIAALTHLRALKRDPLLG
jgi:hypothetical protein